LHCHYDCGHYSLRYPDLHLLGEFKKIDFNNEQLFSDCYHPSTTILNCNSKAWSQLQSFVSS
jgi:hypothetical protein